MAFYDSPLQKLEFLIYHVYEMLNTVEGFGAIIPVLSRPYIM